MTAVTIGISSLDQSLERTRRAMQGEPQGNFIGFVTHDLMLKTLTAKRWDLVKSMAGGGAMSIREAARRVGRDIKSVHGDVQILLKAGVLDHAEDGRIIFPFDEIHVDFVLTAA